MLNSGGEFSLLSKIRTSVLRTFAFFDPSYVIRLHQTSTSITINDIDYSVGEKKVDIRLFETECSVINYGNTIDIENILDYMLVPSRSSKSMNITPQKALPQSQCMINTTHPYLGWELYITCGGVTINHIKLPGDKLQHLVYQLALPLAMPLVVSRDDVLLNQEWARQVFGDSIYQLVTINAIRTIFVYALIDLLEKYADQSSNGYLIRNIIQTALRHLIVNDNYLVVPVTQGRSAAANQILGMGRKVLQLRRWSYHNAHDFLTRKLQVVKRYVGYTMLKCVLDSQPISIDGFNDLIFAPFDVSREDILSYENKMSIQMPLFDIGTSLSEKMETDINLFMGLMSLMYDEPPCPERKQALGILYRYVLNNSRFVFPFDTIYGSYNFPEYTGIGDRLFVSNLDQDGDITVTNMFFFFALSVLDLLFVDREDIVDAVVLYLNHLTLPALNACSMSKIVLLQGYVRGTCLAGFEPSVELRTFHNYRDVLQIKYPAYYSDALILPQFNSVFTKTSIAPSQKDSSLHMFSTAATRGYLEYQMHITGANRILGPEYAYKTAVVYSACMLRLAKLSIMNTSNQDRLSVIRQEFLVRYDDKLCEIIYDEDFTPVIINVQDTTAKVSSYELRIYQPMVEFVKIVQSYKISPPRPIPQEPGEIEGEFYVTQLINLLARKEIDTRVGRLGSTYLLEAANAPKGMELQSLQIVLRSGTDKEYFSAALTELLQNSIDAIRRVSGEGGHYIEVDTDGYSYSVADTVGIDPVHIPSLLIPFLSSKNGADVSTGEMGTGFYSILREDMVRHVDIITLHSGRSLRLRLKVDGNDIHVSWKIDPYSNVDGENGTRIVVTLLSHNKDATNVASARIGNFVQSFGPYINIPFRFNRTPLQFARMRLLAQNDYYEVYTSESVSRFASILMTNMVPYGYLDDHITTLESETYNRTIRMLLSQNFIVNIKKNGYKPVQSRNRLNVTHTMDVNLIARMVGRAARFFSFAEYLPLMGRSFTASSVPVINYDEFVTHIGHNDNNGLEYLLGRLLYVDVKKIVNIAESAMIFQSEDIPIIMGRVHVPALKFIDTTTMDEDVRFILTPFYINARVLDTIRNKQQQEGKSQDVRDEEKKRCLEKADTIFDERAMRFYQGVIDIYWKRLLVYRETKTLVASMVSQVPTLHIEYLPTSTAQAHYSLGEHKIVFNIKHTDTLPTYQSVLRLLNRAREQPSIIPTLINTDSKLIQMFAILGGEPGTLWHELLHAVLNLNCTDNNSAHAPITIDGISRTFPEMASMIMELLTSKPGFYEEIIALDH